MDCENDLIDNETFDFADGMLSDDDKENTGENDEEEVFFGPVTFKERCRERWASDRAGLDFEAWAAKMQVEDWCEIFTNANLVASTLMAGGGRDAVDAEPAPPHAQDARTEKRPSKALQERQLPAVVVEPPERRETFTLEEATGLLNTPHNPAERRSALSDTSSYYTARSNLSSPSSGRTSSVRGSPSISLDDLKTPVGLDAELLPSVTPPTVKAKARRSFLPTPQRGTTAPSPLLSQERLKRRSVSCEDVRTAAVVPEAPGPDTATAAGIGLGGADPQPRPALRPCLSDLNVPAAVSSMAESRLRLPAPLFKDSTRLNRLTLASLGSQLNKRPAGPAPSRLPAPSSMSVLRPINSQLPRLNSRLPRKAN